MTTKLFQKTLKKSRSWSSIRLSTVVNHWTKYSVCWSWFWKWISIQKFVHRPSSPPNSMVAFQFSVLRNSDRKYMKYSFWNVVHWTIYVLTKKKSFIGLPGLPHLLIQWPHLYIQSENDFESEAFLCVTQAMDNFIFFIISNHIANLVFSISIKATPILLSCLYFLNFYSTVGLV